MKARTAGIVFGLMLFSAGVLHAEGPAVVTLTGKVLGHVIAGDDGRIYETVPSAQSEALMDYAGNRVRVTGVVIDDGEWSRVLDVTEFSAAGQAATAAQVPGGTSAAFDPLLLPETAPSSEKEPEAPAAVDPTDLRAR